MHDDYFEAIIQLRNPNPDALKFLDRNLGNSVSKIKKVRNGFDFYIKATKKAEIESRALRDRFGGEFTISRKLFSRHKQTSKALYRTNFLVRLPDYVLGECLKIGKSLYRITGLSKRVNLRHLRTWKSKVIHYPKEYEIIEKKKTQVIKVKPHLEILDPETYQPVPLQNKPNKELKLGEKIKVVYDRGWWFFH